MERHRGCFDSGGCSGGRGAVVNYMVQGNERVWIERCVKRVQVGEERDSEGR